LYVSLGRKKGKFCYRTSNFNEIV